MTGRINMGSFNSPEQVREIHARHVAYYHATDKDVELINLEPTPTWEKFTKSSYTLIYHSYRGWKVCVLHAGGFGSIPGEEVLFEAEERAAGR